MKRTSFLFGCLALLGLAACAGAQRYGPDMSPEALARGRAHSQLMHEINEATQRSRALLVQGKKAEAEAEADRALRRLDGLDPIDAMPVHELLAEIFVEQGRYRLALEELRFTNQESFNVRLGTTTALALVGADRGQEAVPLLGEALKDANMPVVLLGDRNDLPSAGASSKTTLAATAYLLRGVGDYRTRPMDIETALRLAPGNPVVALNAARFYRKTAKRPDLARKALAGAVGGSAATRALLAQEAASLPAETAKPAGG